MKRAHLQHQLLATHVIIDFLLERVAQEPAGDVIYLRAKLVLGLLSSRCGLKRLPKKAERASHEPTSEGTKALCAVPSIASTSVTRILPPAAAPSAPTSTSLFSLVFFCRRRRSSSVSLLPCINYTGDAQKYQNRFPSLLLLSWSKRVECFAKQDPGRARQNS